MDKNNNTLLHETLFIFFSLIPPLFVFFSVMKIRQARARTRVFLFGMRYESRNFSDFR